MSKDDNFLYKKEKDILIRKAVTRGYNISNFNVPYIKSKKLYKEIKSYRNITEWISDQKLYADYLEEYRNKQFCKRKKK